MTIFEQSLNAFAQHGSFIVIAALALFSGAILCSFTSHRREKAQMEALRNAFEREKEKTANVLAKELELRVVPDPAQWVRDRWNRHCQGTAFTAMLNDSQIESVVKRAYVLNGTHVID